MKLKSILKKRRWGGRRLAELFGKLLVDDGGYGESWEVSDVPEEPSVVLNGPLAGRTLRKLMETDAAALLGRAKPAEGGRFPLLIKLLDCNDRLSVQVHPDAAAAKAIGGNARPKTESWIVLHADEGAAIYLGLRPGATRDAFAAAIEDHTVANLLNVIEPKVGDCFYIPAGTVHAIGRGLVIAEVQETSDTTYRVYDWNHVGEDGRPIELHIEQALASIHFAASDPPGPVPPQTAPGGPTLLLAEPYAQILRDEVPEGGYDFESPGTVCAGLCIEGRGTVAGNTESVEVRSGDAILLPAGVGTCSLIPAGGERMTMLWATPG